MSKPLVFKVILVGEVGVGKTSLFVRLKDDRFIGSKSTLGLDKGEIDFDVSGRAVKVIAIWPSWHATGMVGTLDYQLIYQNYVYRARGIMSLSVCRKWSIRCGIFSFN